MLPQGEVFSSIQRSIEGNSFQQIIDWPFFQGDGKDMEIAYEKPDEKLYVLKHVLKLAKLFDSCYKLQNTLSKEDLACYEAITRDNLPVLQYNEEFQFELDLRKRLHFPELSFQNQKIINKTLNNKNAKL